VIGQAAPRNEHKEKNDVLPLAIVSFCLAGAAVKPAAPMLLFLTGAAVKPAAPMLLYLYYVSGLCL
jgi:hypothetical protein